MPFTLAHAAAALPFRRTRLITSALVIGTFAPDFEFFLRFAPRGPFSHSPRGIFEFTLPTALVVLWLLHRFVKMPVALMLPEPFQLRIAPYLGRFRFLGVGRLALIVGSTLIGIATHILWDSFTHNNTWLYDHWSFLRKTVEIPGYGTVVYCRILWYLCSVIGIAIVWLWVDRWYRGTKPAGQPCDRQLTPAGRTILLAVVPAIAVLLGIVRALLGAKLALPHHPPERIVADAVVTTIALFWWQLVLCGFLVNRGLLAKTKSPMSVG